MRRGMRGGGGGENNEEASVLSTSRCQLNKQLPPSLVGRHVICAGNVELFPEHDNYTDVGGFAL